jgi:phosphoribosylanthranilate isomerase
MRIKICGITSLEDARMAIEAGADYLGFNFYPPSPRSITPKKCSEITSQLVKDFSYITLVGVFVNMPAEQVKSILTGCGLHLAQLHGDEAPEILAEFNGQAFKAFRGVPKEIAGYARNTAPALLVDAAVKGMYGGSGIVADWSAAAELSKRIPLLLAGGLTPENVAEAVRQVQPWGVDVASGVETSPGKKDPGKMKAFVAAIRRLENESIPIQNAGKHDLADILRLQKLAYQSEAELNDDYNIPPLTQTFEQIEAEFEKSIFLKAALNGQIIGSVRAYQKDETCYIGRLIVHPDAQNRGLGSRLVKAIEAQFTCDRFELFTSEKSDRNLYLYRKLGYRDFKQEQLSPKIKLLFLEKTNERRKT